MPLGHRLRGRRPLSPRSDQEAREEKEEAGPNGRRRAGLPLFDLTWPSTVRQGPTKYFGRIATLRRRSFPPAVRLLPPHCSLPALRGFPSAGRRHHILARLQPLAHCVSQNQVARDTGRCKQGGLRLPPPANDPPELRQAWAQFASPRSSRAGFGSKVTITIEPGVHKDRAPSQLPSAALTSTGGTQGRTGLEPWLWVRRGASKTLPRARHTNSTGSRLHFFGSRPEKLHHSVRCLGRSGR